MQNKILKIKKRVDSNNQNLKDFDIVIYVFIQFTK